MEEAPLPISDIDAREGIFSSRPEKQENPFQFINLGAISQVIPETIVACIDRHFDREGNWIDPKIQLDAHAITQDSVKETLRVLVPQLSDLYTVADLVTNDQFPGINYHDIHHILRVIEQGLVLFADAKLLLSQFPYRTQLTLRDLQRFVLDVLFHDIGQAIGKRAVHNENSAWIASSALVVDENDQDSVALKQQICTDIHKHTSALFQPNGELIYKIFVLSDEIEVRQNRVRQDSSVFLDRWAMINHFTIANYIRMLRSGEVEWVFEHSIDDQATLDRYHNSIDELITIPKQKLLNSCIEAIYGRGEERSISSVRIRCVRCAQNVSTNPTIDSLCTMIDRLQFETKEAV